MYKKYYFILSVDSRTRLLNPLAAKVFIKMQNMQN